MGRTLIKTWTKKDFDIQWFSGTGAGGQHRNKHQNCVRIVHIESGITTIAQNSRSRTQNFKEAFNEMGARLKDHYYPAGTKERAPNTDPIRTYNIPDNRVKDNRTGKTTSYDNLDLNNFVKDALALGGDDEEY